MGVGTEVDAGDICSGLMEQGHRSDGDGGDCHERHPHDLAAAYGQYGEQRRRPEQVELLLQAEGPRVLEQGRRAEMRKV